jgi:hypothetical protein
MIFLDNFIPKQFADGIEETMSSLDWNEIPSTSRTDGTIEDYWKRGSWTGNNVKETPQYVHECLSQEEHYFNSPLDCPANTLLTFVLYHTQMTFISLMRVKANMIMRQPDYPDGVYNTPHVDFTNDQKKYDDNLWTFLYYVNDSDGDTYFFKDKLTDNIPEELTVAKTFTPRKGTGILFKGDILHASSPPRLTNNRKVINICFRGM